MGITYYKGKYSYSGQDKVNKIESLRNEARELRKTADINRSIGYMGHAASCNHKANQLFKEADYLE